MQQDKEEVTFKGKRLLENIGEEASEEVTNESSQLPKASKELSKNIPISYNDGKMTEEHSEQIKGILKARIKFSLTKENKAAKTLGVILGAFIVCCTPFILCYITGGIPGTNVPYWLFQLVTWLGYLNSGLNPIIYTIYNQEFRKVFVKILKILSFRKFKSRI